MKTRVYFKTKEDAEECREYLSQWYDDVEIVEEDYSKDYHASIDIRDERVNGVLAKFCCTDDVYTYDVFFQSDDSSNNKGFKDLTLEECKDYINQYNGTNQSYFADYKGGVVEIVCNETGIIVYSENIL